MFGFIQGKLSTILGSSNQKTSPSGQSQGLVDLPSGRLNLIRPSYTSKFAKECIYLEASLRIQATSEPFHYQLVIDRTIEGEDEISANEEFEKVFLLNEKLEFRVYQTGDEIGDDEATATFAFSWIDVSSPELSERFEFVINAHHPDCSSEKISQVTDAIYLCIWEAINERDNSEAPEEELLALRYHPEEEELGLEHTNQSQSSEIEQSFQNTSRSAASLDEYESEEDQSASSVDDEIINQLRGTSLADKVASPAPSIPSPFQASDVAGKHADPSILKTRESTPLKKVQIIDPQSPARLATHSSISKPLAPTAPVTHQFQSQVNHTPDRSYEEHQFQSQVDHTPDRSYEEDSDSNDAGDQSVLSTSAQLENQADQKGTVELELPITNEENEPSHDQARLSWSSICNLYLFDSDEIGFKLYRSNVTAELLVSNPHNPNRNICWIRVFDPSLNNLRLISTNIEEENNLVCRNEAIFFNDTNLEQSYTWVLRFQQNIDGRDEFAIAQEAFTRALYERDNGIGTYEVQDNANKEWDRLKYGLIDEEPRIEEDDKGLDEQEDEESEEDLSSSDDEDDDAELRRFRAKNTGPKNSQLTVGFKEDVSFVVRGNMLGLFKNESTSNQKLKFMATIPDISTPDGKRDLLPSKIMLHGQDTTMVLQDASNPNSLYNLDLAIGKVVEEWKITKEGSVRDFIPRTKFSQMHPEGTFLGTSANSFYTIDPRLSGFKAVSNESKSYKTKTDFSCAATTETGQIAIGSNTGEIRLFDSQIGKNAKTLLPAMKDPILHIDVSKDGKYCIATCEKYLVLVDCQLPGSDLLGFQKSFPSSQKPTGKRLELTPEHRAQIHAERIPFRFNHAKFNQGRDAIEKTISTSIGPYIIVFDFRKLKLGHTEYTLRRYEEHIVADSFRWDNDKDIVVTTPSSILLEKRKKLSKPMRESLVFTRQSHSNRPSSSKIRSGNSLAVVQEWDG